MKQFILINASGCSHSCTSTKLFSYYFPLVPLFRDKSTQLFTQYKKQHDADKHPEHAALSTLLYV